MDLKKYIIILLYWVADFMKTWDVFKTPDATYTSIRYKSGHKVLYIRFFNSGYPSFMLWSILISLYAVVGLSIFHIQPFEPAHFILLWGNDLNSLNTVQWTVCVPSGGHMDCSCVGKWLEFIKQHTFKIRAPSCTHLAKFVAKGVTMFFCMFVTVAFRSPGIRLQKLRIECKQL